MSEEESEVDQPDRGAAGGAAADIAVDRKLLELLVCPLTKGRLTYDRDAQELISQSARLAYPIRGGLPIMLVSEAREIEPS